jgi:hypothetical protein
MENKSLKPQNRNYKCADSVRLGGNKEHVIGRDVDSRRWRNQIKMIVKLSEVWERSPSGRIYTES